MLFIFDWDGTVIDSVNKIVSCMQAAMRDAQLAVLDRHSIEQIIGLGMHEATDTLFPKASAEQKTALQQHYSRHFIAADQVPCEFYPGCLDFIERLRQRGHQTGVATGKSRRGLQRVWQATGVAPLFDASRCADETASKPNPRMLLELLDELGVAAQDAVMIGDTQFDLEMARKAGLTGVGVSFGVHSVDRLMQANPVYIADSYLSLQDWLADQYGC